MTEERKQLILNAIAEELERQTTEERPGTPDLGPPAETQRYIVEGEIDVIALAAAIDAALGADTLEAGRNPADTGGAPMPGSSPKGAYARTDEGRTPDELNASNDE